MAASLTGDRTDMTGRALSAAAALTHSPNSIKNETQNAQRNTKQSQIGNRNSKSQHVMLFLGCFEFFTFRQTLCSFVGLRARLFDFSSAARGRLVWNSKSLPGWLLLFLFEVCSCQLNHSPFVFWHPSTFDVSFKLCSLKTQHAQANTKQSQTKGLGGCFM